MKQHSSRFMTLISSAKSRIREITVNELKLMLDRGEPVYLFDVREDNEWDASPHIPGAIHLGKGVIERDIEKITNDPTVCIIVYCSGGFRCALTADNLQQMGFTNVASLQTGLQGWIDAGYPTESRKNHSA